MTVHIVLVTYNWPPRNAIGTFRPYSWAKYWSTAGARISVLTAAKQAFDQPLDLVMPPLPGVEVVEVDFRTLLLGSAIGKRGGAYEWPMAQLKKAKRWLETWLGVAVDARDGWARAAMPDAMRLAEVADVVVSTYGPRASHLIASAMKRHNPHLFWVADYRDLWSQSHLASYTARSRAREADLESRSVGSLADMLTTVSEELADQLQSAYHKPTHVIYNGFDEDDAPAVSFEEGRAGPRKLIYTGLLYPGTRDPTPLFSAIQQLRQERRLEKHELKVEFYGPPADWLPSLIQRYGLEDLVHIGGRVTRAQALSLQRHSDCLLLLESDSPGARGVLTGKLFEYIAADRPILSVGSASDSAIARVLGATGSGVCTGSDVTMLKKLVVELVSGARVAWHRPNECRIASFSRKKQADRLLGLILSQVDAHHSEEPKGQ